MIRTRSLVLTALAATLACGAAAQQQVYRYVDPDGRVVYSDRPPTGSAAKDLQPKRLGANIIENDALPLAAKQASENYPVTLYTFACGQICSTAEAMLNRRGVPFAIVNVEEAKGAERLKGLTGEMTAPVLQVGDKLIAKGYNEGRWQALLDEAGYPRSLPPRTRPLAPATPKAPDPAAQNTTATPAPAGGYPRN